MREGGTRAGRDPHTELQISGESPQTHNIGLQVLNGSLAALDQFSHSTVWVDIRSSAEPVSPWRFVCATSPFYGSALWNQPRYLLRRRGRDECEPVGKSLQELGWME